jgi:hypothetical protein
MRTAPVEQVQWQVTGPQKASARGERRPWGTVHVRRNGSNVTACGLPTLAWYVFWTRRFVPGAQNSCWTCSTADTGADGTPQ